MQIDDNKPNLGQVEWITSDELFFDEHNPRLSARHDEVADQDSILKVLWNEFAVDEVALSISANGFFPYEPLFVAEEVLPSTGKTGLVVVEGNRRLAAVRLLRNSSLRRSLRATDLPKNLSKAVKRSLVELPVIKCERAEIWRFVGFKHVNGPQAWDALAKAEYIAWVHNELGEPLAEVARQIGDRHATVQRLYSGLMALRQSEAAGVFDREDRYGKHFSFSHLYTGLGYSGIQNYLKLSTSKKSNESEQPVPKSRVQNLGRVCLWLYGSKKDEIKPLIRSQNPDLRRLDEALQSPRGVVALEGGLPLTVSVDIAKGDDRILRESLVEAKSLLQTAKARVVTGFSGEPEQRETVRDIQLLADSIAEEMAASASARPKKR